MSVYIKNQLSSIYSGPAIAILGLTSDLDPKEQGDWFADVTSEIVGLSSADYLTLQSEQVSGKIVFTKDPTDNIATPGLEIQSPEEIRDVTTNILHRDIRDLQERVTLGHKRNSELKKITKDGHFAHESKLIDLDGLHARLFNRDKMQAAALSGDMKFQVAPQEAFPEISAAALNAAAAGTFKQLFALLFTDSRGVKHPWANFEPEITVAETVADDDVSEPTITGTPKLVDGAVEVEAVFDTDAGATKTYADSGVKADGGTIVCVGAADLIDDETVGPIIDGNGVEYTFEFNKSDTPVTSGNVAVHVADDATAVQVADALRAEINRIPALAALKVTASGATATVTLTQDTVGDAPNGAIVHTVANGGFSTTPWANGVEPEKLTLTIKPRSDGTWLGHTVAVAKMTYKVVA